MLRIALLVLLVPLAGCGEADELDRSDADAVARGLVAAMAEPDFEAMQRLMSPACFETFQQDLARFQTDLARPETTTGRIVHRIGRERLGPDWDAAVARARAGSFKAAWRLYIRIQPIPQPPEILGSRTLPGAPGIRHVMYRRAGTTQQKITLHRREGIWVVEHVTL